VSGGAEAAVHVTRRLAQNLPSNHVIVKLDFSNAFNCIRRDVVAAKMPQIYCLVHSAYSCEPILVYGERQLRSREGAQQEPLGPLEFCEAIHPLLTSLQSAVRIGFMDDITLAGDICTVEVDVDTIINLDADTGLKLNISKCEIIASILFKFVKVTKDEKTLLGAPVFKGSAQDAVITHKIDQLKRVLERLSFVHSHDALVLLKNSLSMTKLLYLLQTAYCSDNPLQATFDNILRSDLSSILNVDLSDTQWLQASLPVRHGGLIVFLHRCWHLPLFWLHLHRCTTYNSSCSHSLSDHWTTSLCPQCRPGGPCPTAKNQAPSLHTSKEHGTNW